MAKVATVDAAPQHLVALEHANRVRLARAELKRRVAAGETTAAAVVADSPWHADSMSVSELLMSQRRWGHARSRRLLTQVAIPENKRLGTLTERQKTALAEALDPRSGAARFQATGLRAAPMARSVTA